MATFLNRDDKSTIRRRRHFFSFWRSERQTDLFFSNFSKKRIKKIAPLTNGCLRMARVSCGCIYCAHAQVVVAEDGTPFPGARVFFPTPIRIRTDSVTAVAVMESPSGPVRMCDGRRHQNLDAATDAVFAQKRVRRNKRRSWADALWTINLSGSSISFNKLDIANYAVTRSDPFESQFSGLCIDTSPEYHITASGIFGGKLARMLIGMYRPTADPSAEEPRAKKGRKSISKRESKVQVQEDDDDGEHDDEDCTDDFDIRCPAADWTARKVELFCLKNQHKAPLVKKVGEMIPCIGEGNPRFRVIMQHPKTREDVSIDISATVMHIVPTYRELVIAAMAGR
jgi:hypothetical protein